MHGHEPALFLLLAAVALLLLAAYRSSVPYPILLVSGSALLAFIPGAPEVDVDPDVILVVALPPLLYAAAFFTDLHDFRRNLRPIGLLAIGLVVMTTVAVGAVAHWLVGLPWDVAFVLGAIVSPTDPVAATAIAGRLGAPRRYVTVVEGESMVNDATGLIVYKFAIAAVVTGSFSLAQAVGDFFIDAAGGVAIGLAVAFVIAFIRRRVEDAPTEITLGLLTPYFAYLPAEAADVSAVLAAVTAGIYLGWRAPALISPETRIQAYSVWEIVIFLLNSFLFVLIGLQLPALTDALGGAAVSSLVRDGVILLVAVIALRFVWVYTATYVPRLLARDPGPAPRPHVVLLIAWTGMRGAVSLAAALAIPATVDGGAAFPSGDEVKFLVYAVILGSLLLEGLTLPAMITRLGLADGGAEGREEDRARLRASQAALRRLDELQCEDWVSAAQVDRLRGTYEFRIRRFGARFDGDGDGAIEERTLNAQRLRREILEAERAELLGLLRAGEIGEEAMRRIERDLDLEDARLEI